MRSRARVVLSFAIAVIGGLAIALLLAGPALFADGSDQERLVVVAFAVLAEGSAAFIVVLIAPAWRKILVGILVGPVVLVSLALLLSEPQVFRTALLLVFGSVGFVLGGALLASRLADRAPGQGRGA